MANEPPDRGGERLRLRRDDEAVLLVLDEPGNLAGIAGRDDGLPGQHRLDRDIAEVFSDGDEGNSHRPGVQILELRARDFSEEPDTGVAACRLAQTRLFLAAAADKKRNVIG